MSSTSALTPAPDTPMTEPAPTPYQQKRYADCRAGIEELHERYDFTRDDRFARYGNVYARYLLGFITRPHLRALAALIGLTPEEQASVRVSATTPPRPALDAPRSPSTFVSPPPPPTPEEEVEYAALRADIEGAMAAPGFTRDEQVARYGFANAHHSLGFIALPHLFELEKLLGITPEEYEEILA